MTPNIATASGAARTDNLALIFQEVLTAIVRLRSNRQELSDAESFRYSMREAIKAAIQEARNRGYNADDIKMATLALVGFLDESVLNLRNPMFADWPRKPLQEELFGIHMAGELFFRNLEQLMGRADSTDLGDLLEVYYLCLLLGFGGRYSIGGKGELQAITTATGDRIKRMRGPSYDPFMEIHSEPEIVKATEDPWLKKFAIIAAVCFVLVVALFLTFKFTLGSSARQVNVTAADAKL
ncbi:MAG TPA: DotU family type IV/VI secretion system protein [Bryobacteraceae bacterium]|jgi:type VI secretion system protein ImpK|nr:DotU family type IV/VI secretion system protein [Bryobacteraceae bacterium]